MRFHILILSGLILSCSSLKRGPAEALTPALEERSLSLSLQNPAIETVEYLKKNLKANPLSCESQVKLDCLPERARRTSSSSSFERSAAGEQGLSWYFKRFRNQKWTQKKKRADQVASDFTCERLNEPYALAWSSERDFPDTEAIQTSISLYEKIASCQNNPEFQREVLIRLSLIALSQGENQKAIETLSRIPEKDRTDRVRYLLAKAEGRVNLELGYWGAYSLAENEKSVQPSSTFHWSLSAESGSAEWNQVLATYLDYFEKQQYRQMGLLGNRLNLDEFQKLPASFQMSFLVLAHWAQQDLFVFQNLNRLVGQDLTRVRPELVNLLYPPRFWEIVVSNAKDFDPLLVKSVIRQESAFNPEARSLAGARGLMQLIYPTARKFGVHSRHDLLKPQENIRAGAKFLKRLVESFGSVELALAAYNAGPDKVREWQQRYPVRDPDLFVEMIPYKETREYIRFVLRNYRAYQNLVVLPESPGSLAAVSSTPSH